MESEQKFYLFALVCLTGGLTIAYINGSVPIALISLVFGVGNGILGRRAEKRIQEKQELIDELLEDKTDLKEGLTRQRERVNETEQQLEAEQEEKERLQEAKKRENQRLSNLKRALRQKGISTDYLVEKYDSALYAPLMVLTHFNAPNNNSEKDAEFIKSNLEALDTKMLHGSARIVPPRNFDQSLSTKGELREWFDENVLGGRTDLAHKLEAISVVDVAQTFDRDATDDESGRGFETHTVSELFETDTVIPTEDLLDILSRSDRISLEEELRENIALLAVQGASESQMDQVLEAQQELEEQLGGLTQIAQTDVGDISAVLNQHDVEDSDSLAESIRDEAERLDGILN